MRCFINNIVYKLLQYYESKCFNGFYTHLMNRDLNGSRNILYLMKEWIQHRKRPTIFCRKPLIISQDE